MQSSNLRSNAFKFIVLFVALIFTTIMLVGLVGCIDTETKDKPATYEKEETTTPEPEPTTPPMVEEEPAPVLQPEEEVTPSPQPEPAPQPAPTESVTVYITNTGEKYHRDGCQYLRQSKIPVTLEEAKARGYEP